MPGKTVTARSHLSAEPDTPGLTDCMVFNEWIDLQEQEDTASGPHTLDSLEAFENDEENPDGQQVQEPTVTEYARFHGLCIDHRLNHPLKGHHLSVDQVTFEVELQDHDELNEPGTSEHFIDERLTIGRDTAAYIKNILAGPRKVNEIDEGPLTPTRTAATKQKLPLLYTDNELDLKSFVHVMSLDLANVNLPFELVDEEKDEGMTWPKRFHNLPSQINTETGSEKLEITKHSFMYLQVVLQDDSCFYDLDDVERSEPTYRRVSVHYLYTTRH